MKFFKNLFNSLFNSSKKARIIKETVKGDYENISELMAAAKQGKPTHKTDSATAML